MGREHRSGAERVRILAIIDRDGLTDAAAARRFGISERTLRNWRPVSKRVKVRRLAHGHDPALAALVRARIRAGVLAIFPRIFEEELAALLRPAPRERRFR